MGKRYRVLVVTLFVLFAVRQLVAAPIQWTVASGGNGHWYEGVYVGSNTLWTYANAVATAKGGYLASITSAAENSFVTNLVSDLKYWDANSSGTFGPWIGGYQYDKLAEPAGHWAWTSGESWSYTNWNPGEPNNAYNREDYLQLDRNMTTGQFGTWNDQMNSAEWCTVLGYVVEYNSYPTASVQTVSFQQGVNNYKGTSDTMLLQASPNQTSQSATTLTLVNSPGSTSQGLLEFNNIIGNAAGQVPPGAKIVSAMLQWATSDTSNTTCELHRMLVPWSDATATWNSMTNGIQADGIESLLTADTVVSPTGTSLLPLTTTDVTTSLQAWANGAANDGWAMLPTGNDSWGFSSCEGANPPVLTVTYMTPEPSTFALLGVGALGLLGYVWRRRRAKRIVRFSLAAAVVVSAVSAQADVFNMGGTISGGTWTGLASLQFVTVGDPGNVADTNGQPRPCGTVSNVYEMGKYDVTAAQYTAFLNAVAATDPYGLYNPAMPGQPPPPYGQPYQYIGCGITRSGSSGNYTYSVAAQSANYPVDWVSWGDAARFCNWLQNGQPTGAEGVRTTETGAYTLNGGTTDAALATVSRNAGAQYFLPTEDEWYKAAYYIGGGTAAGYWTYPTRSNSAAHQRAVHCRHEQRELQREWWLHRSARISNHRG